VANGSGSPASAAATADTPATGRPTGTTSAPRFDLNGEWEGRYNNLGRIEIEKIMIQQLGNDITFTKITGDAFVPAGKTTLRGIYESNPFHREVQCADTGYVNPRWGKTTVAVIDASHIKATEDDGVCHMGEGLSFARPGKPTLSLDSAILFDFDKAALKQGTDDTINKVVSLIAEKHPNSRLTVAGYTDDRGSDSHNLDLSKRRAMAVAARLQSDGISAERLTIEGFGKLNPRYPNTNDEARAHNRRVEIIFLD
jgi:outer membrane protein OmpA-like peptidoglycan-associated protein